jgi:hypothetical protein
MESGLAILRRILSEHTPSRSGRASYFGWSSLDLCKEAATRVVLNQGRWKPRSIRNFSRRKGLPGYPFFRLCYQREWRMAAAVCFRLCEKGFLSERASRGLPEDTPGELSPTQPDIPESGALCFCLGFAIQAVALRSSPGRFPSGAAGEAAFERRVVPNSCGLARH